MSSTCPDCHSKAFKRNGYTRHGKQNHRCLDCGRQFSLEPQECNMQDDAIVIEQLLNSTSTQEEYSYNNIKEAS